MKLSGAQQYVMMGVANGKLPKTASTRTLRSLRSKGLLEFIDVRVGNLIGGKYQITERGWEVFKTFAARRYYGDGKDWGYISLTSKTSA